MFLYYITDRRQLSPSHGESLRRLLDLIGSAAKAGVDAIQLREKDLSARELLELGIQAAQIVRDLEPAGTRQQKTRLLINSRVDVAIACRADGVHLRSDDIAASEARAILLAAGITQPFIGVSCHSLAEVELAEGHGANFAVFGPVFGKKGAQGIGIEELEEACRRRRAARPEMPVLALGGVQLSNATECLRAGASGIAAIGLFQSGNIAATISELRKR